MCLSCRTGHVYFQTFSEEPSENLKRFYVNGVLVRASIQMNNKDGNGWKLTDSQHEGDMRAVIFRDRYVDGKAIPASYSARVTMREVVVPFLIRWLLANPQIVAAGDEEFRLEEIVKKKREIMDTIQHLAILEADLRDLEKGT